MWKLEIYDVKETWTHDTHSGGFENFAAWRRNESRVWESCSRCAVRIMSANMSRKSTWGERKSWGRATSWEPTCSRHEIDFSSIKTKRRDLTKEIKFQSGRNSDQSYCRSRFFFHCSVPSRWFPLLSCSRRFVEQIGNWSFHHVLGSVQSFTLITQKLSLAVLLW